MENDVRQCKAFQVGQDGLQSSESFKSGEGEEGTWYLIKMYVNRWRKIVVIMPKLSTLNGEPSE